jgi:hypothetical protein
MAVSFTETITEIDESADEPHSAPSIRDQKRRVLRRAFDKAVRRKPLAVAADAGLWQLNE